MAKTLELDLLGQKIPVKTEGDDGLIAEVVELANQKIDDARRRTPTAAPHQIAVLALLDMTEEYVKARARSADHRNKVTSRTSDLVKMIQAELNL